MRSLRRRLVQRPRGPSAADQRTGRSPAEGHAGRLTPVRIASYQGVQSVSCGPVPFVDVIASPSFVAAIKSGGAAVSGSLFAAIASDGVDASALVVSVDDSASISR